MVPLLFVALLAVPIAELWVILAVSQRVGIVETVALLVAVSVTGAWLLKQQGMATWRRLHETLRRGEVPAREVTDGALILLGGALLLTPGFLTDAVGLVLVIPPTRAFVKGTARRLLGTWARRRWGSRLHVAEVIRARVPGAERGRHPASPPASLPPRPGEDGSPDRG